MNKLLRIWLLGLVLISFLNVFTQSGNDNTIIVSGFVLNSSTLEGVTANITIKNAETFKVIAVIPTTNISGSYTFRLKRGKYYFIIETPGFELYNVLVDLNPIQDKRIQRNLVLLPLGAEKKGGYIQFQDANGKNASEVDPPKGETKTDISAHSIVDINKDNIEVEETKEIVDVKLVDSKKDTSKKNTKRVVTQLQLSKGGKLELEQQEEVQPTENTQTVGDVTEGRESDINFMVKDGAQFINLDMYFSNNDASIVNVTEQLGLVLYFLKQNPETSIEIRGYAEDGFSNKENKALAFKRAVACRKYFIMNGISMNRVQAIAYPTTDYEISIERKRQYRKQHLVEFRIKGDENFENSFVQNHYEEYSQYKEGEIELSDEETPSNDDSQEDSGDRYEGARDEDTMNEGSDTNEDQLSNVDEDAILDFVNSVPTIEDASEASPVTANDEINVNKQDETDRLALNEIGIGSEGAEIDISYEGYETEQEAANAQRIFDALNRINASANRIEQMLIRFDPMLPELDEVKYKNILDSISNFLRDNRRYKIHFNGYASKKGDKKMASKVHTMRAQAVKDYFLDLGIDKDRLKFHGMKLHPDKDSLGNKIPIENQMIVTFEIEKPEINMPTVKTGPVSMGPKSTAGSLGGDPGRGVKVVVPEEEKEVEIPEFATDAEYNEYLKNNQNDLKVDGLYFRVQVGAYKLPVDQSNPIFKVDNVELLEGSDGWYRYVTEKYVNINEAYKALKKIQKKIDDAFVLAFYNNDKISMRKATELLLKSVK